MSPTKRIFDIGERAFQPPPSMKERLLKTEEVATFFGVHPITIYNWKKNNPDFPKPIRISANRIAWRWSDIEAFVERCVEEAAR